MYTMTEYRIPLLRYADRGAQMTTWVVLDPDGLPVTTHTDAEEAAWRVAWHIHNRERLVRFRARAAARLEQEMQEYHT